MATGIQYKSDVQILSGGYPGEIHGADGAITNWTEAPLRGTATVNYYYHDSDSANNANSSRVTINVTDKWEISIEDRVATIKVKTTINSIVRSIYAGYAGSVGRDIKIYDRPGGTLLLYADNTPVNVNAPITLYRPGGQAVSLPYTVAEHTFVLPPGGAEASGVGTLYYYNHFVGGPETELYTDAMYLGMNFRNSLPLDYRPGKIWNGTSWQSHNRNGGACNIRGTNGYIEMRTVDGGEGSDNPPYIRHSSGNKNMRLIGENA